MTKEMVKIFCSLLEGAEFTDVFTGHSLATPGSENRKLC